MEPLARIIIGSVSSLVSSLCSLTSRNSQRSSGNESPNMGRPLTEFSRDTSGWLRVERGAQHSRRSRPIPHIAQGSVAGDACAGCPVPRPHSNPPSSARGYAKPRRGASRNGRTSSEHASGLTDGAGTQPGQRLRPPWLLSREHYSSLESADNQVLSPTPNVPYTQWSPPHRRNRPSGSRLGSATGDRNRESTRVRSHGPSESTEELP